MTKYNNQKQSKRVTEIQKERRVILPAAQETGLDRTGANVNLLDLISVTRSGEVCKLHHAHRN
jgi:hypothetical protein